MVKICLVTLASRKFFCKHALNVDFPNNLSQKHIHQTFNNCRTAEAPITWNSDIRIKFTATKTFWKLLDRLRKRNNYFKIAAKTTNKNLNLNEPYLKLNVSFWSHIFGRTLSNVHILAREWKMSVYKIHSSLQLTWKLALPCELKQNLALTKLKSLSACH